MRTHKPLVASKRLLLSPLCGALRRLQTGAGSPPPLSPGPGPSKAAGGFRLPKEEGISQDLGGFGTYAGSITAFMKSDSEKAAEAAASPKSGPGGGGGPLPCETRGSDAALQAAEADRYMADVAMTGKLPSPRDRLRQQQPLPAPDPTGMDPSAPLPSPRRPPAAPSPPGKAAAPPPPRQVSRPASSSLPKRPQSALRSPAAPPRPEPVVSTPVVDQAERAKEAEDYYSSLSRNELSKEDMWNRILKAKADSSDTAAVVGDTEVEYLKMMEDLEQQDLFHFRLGEMAFPDPQRRRDYYTLWSLAIALNKARWTMLEVQAQRGVKSSGAGMKALFWKESVNTILERRGSAAGQFTQSHPVLVPFGSLVERHPKLTKAFVRGFTDARLRVIQQPGNMKQLFDHFDKFYSYFFNTLLEVLGIKDDNAEHMMLHIGRAIGLTTHCVMFWKKYARIGFTMLPADICADNHVNLSLLKNIPLASRDRAVRRVLYEIMCVAKDEMLHAQGLAPLVPPTVWPVAMECFYPNYYLGFLQRRDFNVSAMFADHNIENAGFVWYRLKKRWEWERCQSLERLLSEAAPLPYIGTSISHRGSEYRMAASSEASDGKGHGHSHGHK